jgi:hypothetical protein
MHHLTASKNNVTAYSTTKRYWHNNSFSASN